MQTERRIAKCAVLVALVLLGGACTKIDAVRSDGKQTQEAVMAAASAAGLSVEWAAAAATAAAVAAAVKNTKTRRTAVGGMPAAVLFLGFRREGNSFDKSTLLTYTEKHA